MGEFWGWLKGKPSRQTKRKKGGINWRKYAECRSAPASQDIAEMEIVEDEMASKKRVDNGVKFVNPKSSVTKIKFDNIPESILVEVLIRLPVKMVFVFKLVCKQWLSVISDPSFVRMYTSRALMCPQFQSWTFIFHTMRVEDSPRLDYSQQELLVDIRSIDSKHPSLCELPCPCTQHLDKGRYIILGVSNGLVLYGLCIEMDHRFYFVINYNICNPITGQWTALPPHTHRTRFINVGFVTCVEDRVLTSYRVVLLNVLSLSSNVIEFEVFSSESGEWKDFNVRLDLKIQFALSARRPTSLNGILHWVTRKHGIIAYDPYHKPDHLHFISFPGGIDLAPTNITHLGITSLCDVHQRRLSYFEMAGAFMPPHGFSRISVWVLNDYSIGDWFLQHRITSTDILYDGIPLDRDLSLQPISFHPFDSDIIYFGYENMIVSYNIKTRTLKADGDLHDVEDYYKNRLCWWLAYLLVIPPWPIYIPPPSFGVMEA